jgi:hypothetical protein
MDGNFPYTPSRCPSTGANQEPIDRVAAAPFATIICGIAGRAVAVIVAGF